MDSLAHASTTIMDDGIRVNMLRCHFVYTTATKRISSQAMYVGRRKANLPYEVSAST